MADKEKIENEENRPNEEALCRGGALLDPKEKPKTDSFSIFLASEEGRWEELMEGSWGRCTYDVCSERGAGGWPISDQRKGGCVVEGGRVSKISEI